MGEEIGMTDPEYHSIDDYVDVEARNAYNALIDQGVDAAEAFAIVHSKARDNSRTPMQWDDSPNAGFTTGTPWLRPTNQEHINVAAEEQGGKSSPTYKNSSANGNDKVLFAQADEFFVVGEDFPPCYFGRHIDVLLVGGS